MRARIRDGASTPREFRHALLAVPPLERDAWLDAVLELDEVPDDGPALPKGGVPYLPCPVEAVLRAVEEAGVDERDVFVDVGQGVGRVTALVHLLTGAAAIGVEIQPQLVAASRLLLARTGLERVSVVEGDAAELVAQLPVGTVFFLYCPFGGARLERTLASLEAVARSRPLRLCTVDLPLPQRAWLTPVTPSDGAVAVYRSFF